MRTVRGCRIDEPALQAAIHEAIEHESPWSRHCTDPSWGIHLADPAPYNRLRGPVHDRGGPSGVISIGGEVIAQWGDPRRADLTFSVAKTYLAMLAGVAFDEGLLPDVDEPVRVRAGGIGFDEGANRQVTWAHLLQQTSEWSGQCFGIPDQVDRYRVLPYQRSLARGVKGEARPLDAPGSFWEYNDVRINQLSRALLHLFRRPLAEVFRQRIAQPAGASEQWQWVGYDDAWEVIDGQRMPSVPGGTHWGAGVSISALDQARIARLLLAQGRAGTTQVLSEAWVARMLQPCPIAPFYGYLTWLNTTRRVFPSAPASSFFSIGAGASYIWMEPQRDMVVVVRWIDGEHGDAFFGRICNAIIGPDAPGQDRGT
jgi:CubicO group peptidase (beta-lactamase class C family)